MEGWFRQRFEDPAESTPYDSASGGYQWIWGGPYDAEEELHGKFQGIVPDELIEELVTSLQRECIEWAPIEQPGDYDHGLFDAVSQNWQAEQTLNEALVAIDSLLAAPVAEPLDATHRRLLFANAISALETFLSDTFINRVFGNEALLQTYIDYEPKFRERKVAYRDVLREAPRVTEEARKEVLNVVWHNLGKVKPMYEHVLGVDLGDLGPIAEAIQIRHDIVHRNGRRRDGALVVVELKDVLGLIRNIQALAAQVELHWHCQAAAYIDNESSPF